MSMSKSVCASAVLLGCSLLACFLHPLSDTRQTCLAEELVLAQVGASIEVSAEAGLEQQDENTTAALQALEREVLLPPSVPLDDLPDLIQRLASIPVIIDERALKFADVPTGALLAFTEGQCPLGSSLRAVLRPLELRAVADNEVILITADLTVLVHRGIGVSRWINVDEQAEKVIASKLATQISFDFVSETLENSLRIMSEEVGLPIRLDHKALEDTPYTPHTTIDLTLREVTLRTFLDLMLHNLQLTLTIQGEVLTVTTPEQAEMFPLTRMYWLEGTGFNGGSEEQLIDNIGSLDPDKWEKFGGTSTIQFVSRGYQGRPAIIVSAPYSLHYQIASLLTAARESHFGPDAPWDPVDEPQAPKSTGTGHSGGLSGGMGGGMGMGGMGMGGMGGSAGFDSSLRRGNYSATPLARTRGLDLNLRTDQGRGPGMAGDRFEMITENPFQRPDEHPLSTFSIDVDTASYSKVRQFLTESGRLPRPDMVRIEELVNYFDYGYADPPAESRHPLAVDIEIAQCPWNSGHRLARVAVQAKRIAAADRPPCNLVFLIDTSGSMNSPNRLPLVQRGMEMLLDSLNEHDRVAVAVYAGSAGLVLDSTPATEAGADLPMLTQLQAGGSTNGGAGIRLAYQTARHHFIPAGVNRVILCTDGDFNVGTTSPDELIRLVKQQAGGGIDLTVLGFGMGNHNDAMLEKISGEGNGNYAFIDNPGEARRVLIQRATSTLFSIARDVKIQVELNPAQVAAYRLIGYENRLLAMEDFNDDTKDAGEVGAGHSVTAFYELIPHQGDTRSMPPEVDPLKYQRPLVMSEAADSDEVLTVKLRYKPIQKADEAKVGIDGGGVDAESILVEFASQDSGQKFAEAGQAYRMAALVAAFGLQLRSSEHRGTWTMSDVLREATSFGDGQDEEWIEWIDLVRLAAQLQSADH